MPQFQHLQLPLLFKHWILEAPGKTVFLILALLGMRLLFTAFFVCLFFLQVVKTLTAPSWVAFGGNLQCGVAVLTVRIRVKYITILSCFLGVRCRICISMIPDESEAEKLLHTGTSDFVSVREILNNIWCYVVMHSMHPLIPNHSPWGTQHTLSTDEGIEEED